jgi:two-component system chemotaxis response regulator CheY
MTWPLDVLVADDDPVALAAIASAVRGLGHRCREAADGNAAWSMLEERRADVVISDWQMPAMSGPALCRRTRVATEEAPYTYFILVTGFHDREHLLEGMAAGADDFQKKPVDLDELEARLISAGRVVALHRRLAQRTKDLRHDSQTFFAVSRTDPLTGIGNRLRMDEELAAAHSRALRYGHAYSAAICDVDRFKDFNDALGHLAGDEALRRVADAIRAGLRLGDGLYRYGGEEFVVLLPEQSLSEAALVMDRIRASIERLAILAPLGTLTISGGVAELNCGADLTVDDWLVRADAALYGAKEHGRNRVEAART